MYNPNLSILKPHINLPLNTNSNKKYIWVKAIMIKAIKDFALMKFIFLIGLVLINFKPALCSTDQRLETIMDIRGIIKNVK